MELRLVLPKLVRRMAEDLEWASKGFYYDFETVLFEYTAILNYVIEIFFFLPEECPELERQAVRAITAFLRGDETRERLKKKLMAILEDYKEKTEEEG